MNFGKRFIWVSTIVAFLAMASGCAQTSLISVEEEIVRKGADIHKDKGQSVRGYHLHDGTREEYKGWVKLVDQDSLAFWDEGYSDEVSHQGIKKKIKIPGPVFPLSVVKELEVRERRTARTVLLVAAGIIGALAIAYVATFESNY